MNKQELTGKIKSANTIYVALTPLIEKKFILDLVKQLEEPQKVQVPQLVADWYEDIKDEFYVVLERLVLNYKNNTNIPICKWFLETEGALTILSNMHQFGYEVEKEKEYTVKVKAVLGQYLGRYYLNNEELTPQFKRTQLAKGNELPTFTRKELEQAGFGWVFDCEGIEIEEVEE